MPKLDPPLLLNKTSETKRTEQAREIEAVQEGLRRSIAESRRLIEQASEMTRRHKDKESVG